ncbi:hypothetical protein O181_006868 [Austropuccinia psidii MF-1]|uniref:Uncharacterized protein n=1 Tax=Austropuccinia psidii MF-1 TaxID=1389203 RepID=A0A9Q3GH02_9BASI|nr:hypothetical protein [Austropuccinia psidii MF-1]
MSSSNPHKSCSESVNDFANESSMEYVQKQSPMSPKIPLIAPIAFLINVSGLNIDVGTVALQTSTSLTIPNIYFTPVPPYPTNMQMNVSEGPGSTPESF